MRRIAGIALLVCIVGAAQDQADKPRFEVASIKATPDSAILPIMKRVAVQDLMPAGMMQRSGQNVYLRQRTLTSLIATAYRVKTTEIAGPAWMADEFFDVEAKMPAGADAASVYAMLQTLLEDRFGLQIHHETRAVQGYELVVAKNGPKLKESAKSSGAAEKKTAEEMAVAMRDSMQKKSQAEMTGMNRQTAQGVDSTELASIIARMAQAPVVDKTGLTGRYDVEIETAPDRPDQPGRTIFEAVSDLGLKLEAHKVPVQTVVVDRVNKAPTEN